MTIMTFGGDALAKLSALNESQAVIEFKMDGTIITANENFLKLTGYSLEGIVDKHHSNFVEQGHKESGASATIVLEFARSFTGRAHDLNRQVDEFPTKVLSMWSCFWKRSRVPRVSPEMRNTWRAATQHN
tara:strand:+ start:3600 stop:3989 length:390 start_codon:yes stop_codon:yes gene_type:complete